MKTVYNTLPSFPTNSDFEFADTVRNKAAEFGLKVSSVADNSISGFIIPF